MNWSYFLSFSRPKEFARFFITCLSLAGIVFILLPVHGYDGGYLSSVYYGYLSLAEIITNLLSGLFNLGFGIRNHSFVFENVSGYHQEYKEYIINWQEYILFKKWFAGSLLLFWITKVPLHKKVYYSLLLFPVHILAIVSGMILTGYFGPVLYEPESLSQFRPHIIGSLLLFTIIASWLTQNKEQLLETFNKLRIKLTLSDRKLNEVIVLLYVLIVLKHFVVPFFNFYSYIHFLLSVTEYLVTRFGYHPEIDGPYLIGKTGTLFMAKWCLGFITMLVFSAVVYLTRNEKISTWLFIAGGIIFLHIVNIIRLAVLFIFVQKYDSSNMVIDHHELFNIVVYILIFGLWILWFEKFSIIKRSKKVSNKS